MAKASDETVETEVVVQPAPAAAPVQPASFPLMIEEFCTELSGRDRRPELIYAFSKDEMSAGRIKDTAENFQARFAAFAAKPV